MQGKGWIAAGDLIIGDEVHTLDGDTGTVTGLTLEKLDTPIAVYSLEVEEFNSYFVGEGVLVHNKCQPKAPKWEDNLDTPLQKLLQGRGQITDLRNHPHIKDFGADYLLTLTPREIEKGVKDGMISKTLMHQLRKHFKGKKLPH